MKQWQATWGHIDITPEASVGGSPNLLKKGKSAFSHVEGRLEAHAVVLGTGKDRVALVTLDAFFVGGWLRAALQGAVETVLPPERLWLFATHTHTAPNLDPTLPELGRFHQGYADLVSERVGELLKSLLNEEPTEVDVTLTLEQDQAQSIHRRRLSTRVLKRPPFLLTEMLIAPNPQGPRDPNLRIFMVREQGKPVAVLWNYACHPVCFPDAEACSGDYPAVVRDRVQREFGENVSCVHLPGAMGDLRPRVLNEGWSPDTLARGRFGGAVFGTFDSEGFERWAGSIASSVVAGVRANDQSMLEPELVVATESVPIEDLRQGDSSTKRLEARRLDLGPHHSLVALSAEPVVEYGPLVQALVQGRTTVLLGYLGEVFGYLPVESMLSEGGYEVDGFNPNFSRRGGFRPGFEAEVMQLIRRVL